MQGRLVTQRQEGRKASQQTEIRAIGRAGDFRSELARQSADIQITAFRRSWRWESVARYWDVDWSSSVQVMIMQLLSMHILQRYPSTRNGIV